MLPTVNFFGTRVTRVIIGDNPFSGHSYIPDIASGQDMMNFYTADTIVRTLFEAEYAGFNTYIPLGDPFIQRVIRQYRNEGGTMHLVFQPYPAIDLPVNLMQMMACKPLAIYHQGTTTDGLIEEGKVAQLRDNLKRIRETGVPVGLGTHVPETVLRAEMEDWGVDFYMTCLHNTRKRGGQASSFLTGKEKTIKFFMEDREEMFRAIREVPKPCIAFKAFAGGQVFLNHSEAEIPGIVETVYRETFSSIKPTDLVGIGVFQRDKNQLTQNAEIAARVLQAPARE